MSLVFPELSLVVLIGASGSGKSTFARKHFLPTEILSSDFCRGLVADDENDQTATNKAFEILHFIAEKRLEAGRLTVIDATNVQTEARKPLIDLARKYHFFSVAIVMNVSEKLCQERNSFRENRNFGRHVVRQQCQQLRRSIRQLGREGFRYIFVLNSPEEIESCEIQRTKLWNNRRDDEGPFDIIGDIHGCFDELYELMVSLGYEIHSQDQRFDVSHPDGRKVVFVGDLVDRGPKTPEVLRLVMDCVQESAGLCVSGNHDMKLLRKLNGKDVRITHGLAESLQQLEKEPAEFIDRVKKFLEGLISHYVFDNGKLVVAHAGMKMELQGRGSSRVREFGLYGETTGETDEFGLPVRYNWAADYRGQAIVVYGHTPVPEPEWLNGTINIDTGCVFGGKLTALRYPEREMISIKAKHTYYEPAKPFLEENLKAPVFTAQQKYDDLLDINDVRGKRIIGTRLHHNVTVLEDNATAALEIMSRFAANPKWLIYLPPTMSPCETSKSLDFLEHPAEAFAYYRQNGIPAVVCEEKHMGSRAIVIVCRDEDTSLKRFGIAGEGSGIVYTRTGRRFFDDSEIEATLLEELKSALSNAGFWDEFGSDWFCFDCELMPWSAKAQQLLKTQYAAVAASGSTALFAGCELLEKTAGRIKEASTLLDTFRLRLNLVNMYAESYRRYCWEVNSISDFRLAPFHLLASEGHAYTDKHHVWHMETLNRLCESSKNPILQSTKWRVVDLTKPQSESSATQWWIESTQEGQEGIVVKPFDFSVRGSRGLLQPAVKVRGREYLRIIYGPEYTTDENMERLRQRGLSTKRSLALREFALGVEALERFIRKEPLRRVHECVFGVLALESEPVDPRL